MLQQKHTIHLNHPLERQVIHHHPMLIKLKNNLNIIHKFINNKVAFVGTMEVVLVKWVVEVASLVVVAAVQVVAFKTITATIAIHQR